MERSRGLKKVVKTVAVGLVVIAAMASTGCSKNALLNPTPDQVAASGTTTSNQAGHSLNPAGHSLNP